MKQTVSIDVVSDFVCPWCYVGKRRLEQALQQRPELDVRIRWLPFQLSADLPPEGMDRRDYYASIFGKARAEKIMASMADTGRDDGIEFQNKPGAKSPNTLAAHVVMELVQSEPDADPQRAAERLFHAHHVDCEDIGDADVLVRVASECGLAADTVRACLEDAASSDRVRGLIRQAVERGIGGVPFFILNGRYGMSGAQPVEEFIATLDQVSAADR
jgi:predicted DsbA family dithiol-disulfide isomerase